MGIGINDLDDDDFGMGFEPSHQEENTNEENQYLNNFQNEENNEGEENLLSDFLKTRGIDDMQKIKFEE